MKKKKERTKGEKKVFHVFIQLNLVFHFTERELISKQAVHKQLQTNKVTNKQSYIKTNKQADTQTYKQKTTQF